MINRNVKSASDFLSRPFLPSADCKLLSPNSSLSSSANFHLPTANYLFPFSLQPSAFSLFFNLSP